MASCWTKSGPAAGNRIAAYGLRRRRTDWRCGQFGLAAELIDDCLRQWPQDENSWLLQLQYGFLTGDGALIRRTTEEIQRREIYLSAVGREALRFWGAPEKREVHET